ncbi:U-box domain-containing protein 5-like [Bidens hawaiensis]|uniref:U-box domain-containing protein 5-like n=1 Tax=Bidens hawaiensis TaxID=980011 RepID=UPI00404A2457
MQGVTLLEHTYTTTTTWKVHRLACLEVKKIIEKITKIFKALESARPRCKPGLQALCSLHKCMEKCDLLFRHCSEFSKLYLAISGQKIILRCERICYSLELCLGQLQNMVEPKLAAKISHIVDYIKSVAFTLDASEDEAGQVLLALLHQDIKASKFAQLEELKAFKFAASRLHITSPLAIVMEKRAIRKLLSKILDTDPAKKKILNYLLYLVLKYGKSTNQQELENIEGDEDDVFDPLETPVKFKIRHLSVHSCSSSIPSFKSSLGDLNLQVDHVSLVSSDAGTEDGFGEIQENSKGYNCNPVGPNVFLLGNLSVLPWAARRKAVEDVKNQLKDDQESHLFVSTSYISPVFKFIKEAHRLGDSGAKRHGAELLLMFLKNCRTDTPRLPKGVMSDLSLYPNSDITEEALLILEVLSCQQHYTREIVTSGILLFLLEVIKNQKSEHHKVGLRVLCNLSAHEDIGHRMIYLGFIQHLVPFLDELLLSGYIVKIFENLCAIEEAAAHFVENESCIASIGELLELGIKVEEQEHALEILLSLYYQRD